MQMKLMAIGTVLVAGMLSGCATTAPVSRKAPPVGNGAQQFVNDQMSQTLSSIDNSLKTLLILDRGGEAPRKAGPIGSTVAGAAGVGTAPIVPPMPRAVVEENVLSKRARIQWNGAASQLLSTLAKNVGYTYEEIGSGAVRNVRIAPQEITLRELLSQTAQQIEGQADIRVDTISRRIQLIHR